MQLADSLSDKECRLPEGDSEARVALEFLAPLTAALSAIGADWNSLRQVSGAPHPAPDSVSLSDYLKALERLTSAFADETCHMSTRPLLPGTSAFAFSAIRAGDTVEGAMRKIAGAYNIAHGGYFNSVEVSAGHLTYSINDEGFPFTPDQDADFICLMMEGVLQFVHLCFVSLAKPSGIDVESSLLKVHTRRRKRQVRGDFLSTWEVPIRLGGSRYALIYDRAVGDCVLGTEPEGTPTADFFDRVSTAFRSGETEQVATDVFLKRVRREIARGTGQQADVARELGISAATLRRRLQNSGDSFRQIKADVQYTEARQFLGQGRAVEDVADALGFIDSRSFRRAFKAWSGVTPAAWVRRAAPQL